MGQVEDQGEAQRVGADGQCFAQYPVAADAFEVDALVQQVPLEVFSTDRPGSQGRLRVDQYVPVGSLRPGDATLGEPGQQGLMRQFAKPLGVSGDGDPAVGRSRSGPGTLPRARKLRTNTELEAIAHPSYEFTRTWRRSAWTVANASSRVCATPVIRVRESAETACYRLVGVRGTTRLSVAGGVPGVRKRLLPIIAGWV